MTEIDTTKLTAVDSAGCAVGEIDRPAETLYGRTQVELRDPDNAKAFMQTETPVDLGVWA